MVTARFNCTQILDTGGTKTVTLTPVYSANPNSPNFSWSKATPSGSLTLSITNPEAFKQFIVGRTYHMTLQVLEPAEQAGA